MKNFGFGVAALVVAAVIFQLFLRFQYTGGGRWVYRIDRLTGTSCEIEDCAYYWAFGPPRLQFIPDPAKPPPGFGPPQSP